MNTSARLINSSATRRPSSVVMSIAMERLPRFKLVKNAVSPPRTKFGNIIECAAGDRVLKEGGAARNIFVVLDGTLEVRDDDRIVGVLSAGEAFGEMAFLL